MVINRHMRILPSRSTGIQAAVTSHPMAGTTEAPQLFDVQMQQVTRFLMFIALYWRGRFQISQPIQSPSLQDTGDSTVPYAQRLADVPIGLSLFAQFDNPLLAQVINGMRAGCRLRRAIVQAIRPLLAISSEPLVSGAGTDAGSVSGLFNAQALLKDTLDKELSTKDG
ncbi:hypothetical protein AERO9A_420326 [Aeromonas salmonicida]|nr:hypothetical protein AERO9A_420326 [Aeromonas salmonicida]